MYKKSVQPYVAQYNEGTAFELSEHSIEKIRKLIELDPVSDLELKSSIFRQANNKANCPFIFGNSHSKSKVTTPPIINISEEFRLIRQNLPIFHHRSEILDIVEQHQVIVISGDTGLSIF